MDNARFSQIKALLLAARARDRADRDAFVRERAGDDTALADEVLSLLAHEESGARLVERSALGREEHPSAIGPYRIEEVLGEGGMGVVYRARQDQPVRRVVALKLVQHGLHSERVLRRFAWERQSLARMQHPHIATVLDAGTDERGRPWFVMPLVEGSPITRYGDDHRLDVAARVDLFVEVCRAVEHAHQRGVLHRDLKPSNVLVRELDGRHVPTVIDFGISKALQPEAESQGLTLEGQIVGTPAYMSPEQLRGDEAAIDTRSDVYALGVLLYELLAGRHPWADDGGRVPLDDATASVSSPSTAVSRQADHAVAGARGGTPRTLARRLRGDLDTICLKALRSEPERRYPGVAQLADDLDRWRDGRPVTARPDTLGYRAGKLARRHPLRVGAGLAIVASLIVGTVFLVWHGERLAAERDRAVEAERRARAEAEATRRVAGFLESLFTLAEDVSGAEELSALDMLRRGTARIPIDLEGEPYLQARMLASLGGVHHTLALHADAESLLVASLDQLELARPEIDPDDYVENAATTRAVLATVLHDLGRPAEAVHQDSLTLRLLHDAGRGDDPLVVQALASLGIDLQVQGYVAEAVGPVRESLEMKQRLGDEPDDDLAWGWGTLGYLNFKLGRLDEAEAQFVIALDIAREVFAGEDHFDLIHALNNYGGLLLTLDRLDQAQPILEEALAMSERLYARSEHPAVARQLANLASVHTERGDLVLARDLFERAIAIDQRTLGPTHPRTTGAEVGLARVAARDGSVAEAESLFTAVRTVRRETLAADHPLVAASDHALGRFWLDRGRPERALPYLEAFAAWCEANDAPEHYRRGRADSDIGTCLAALGRSDEARVRLEAAVHVLTRSLGADHGDTREAIARRAELGHGADGGP